MRAGLNARDKLEYRVHLLKAIFFFWLLLAGNIGLGGFLSYIAHSQQAESGCFTIQDQERA